ncbi:DUF5993 family protein [Microbulbifer sp. OS29]|uniref:DUF5993 family protein n=1 Tax=Microbulbifer okhotskensis TaxID=2926617 RepID=A0A9X2J2U5_9GAMM|nr:DUF5993 family protein [Microbulbifer okhotskensis]MCO1332862.1 DUF5993 family protein [Microbulbifer okhotskensis]
MILPFLTAALTVWAVWNGRRRAAMGWWLVTVLIYIAWYGYHMTRELNLSF